METVDVVILFGVSLNFVATIGSAVAFILKFEHRLTKTETAVEILVFGKPSKGKGR